MKKKIGADEWYSYALLIYAAAAVTLGHRSTTWAAASDEIVCPPISDNNCSCYVFDNNVFLECPGVTMAALRRVLAAFVGVPVQSLNLYDLDKSVTTIRGADLVAVPLVVRQLQISLSNVQQLNEDSFANVRAHLESLSIVSGKLKKIPQKTLPYLTALQMVSFESNEIEELPGYGFYGLRLNRINLKGNALRKIAESAFAGLEPTLEEMDLSENKLADFPVLSVRRLERLANLKMAWNEIATMPDDGYSRMKSLSYLDLSSNCFVSIPEDTFRPTPYLKTLSLYYNAIEGIHKRAFVSLTLVESLDLSHNKIVYLDAQTFARNTRLKTISLSHNHVHYIGAVFANLPELRELFLSENNVLDVPHDAFANSSALRVVYLQQNAIRRVDGRAMHAFAASAQQLHLSGNYIDRLPAPLLAGCVGLRSLNADNNVVAELEETIFANATNLRELRLHNNRLATVRRAVFEPLRNLVELHLQYNAIATIEAGAFHAMENLQYVNLQGNLLTALGDVFRHEASALISVQLDSNRIVAVHNGTFHGQSNVQIMWLGRNGLTRLNRTLFADLLLVRRVYLAENSIARIEDGVFEPMQVLAVLDLSGNELRSVTRAMFADAGSVEELYLAANKIQAIESDSFASMGKLRVLDLSDNKLTTLRGKVFHERLPLETLMLRNCSLATVEDGAFAPLQRLESLQLAANRLGDEFAAKLENENLRTLDLRGNNLTKLASWKGLPNLVQLHVDDNRVTTVENKAFLFTNRLKILTVSGNALRNLPGDVFKTNVDLKELTLDGNAFASIPYDAFSKSSGGGGGGGGGDAVSLKKISFAANNLTVVDFSKLKPLRNATEMNFSSNAIVALTGFATRANLTHLTSISFASNLLASLPGDFLQGAVALKRLDLSGNRFKQIPVAAIGDVNLPNLKYLSMADNPLTKIYDWWQPTTAAAAAAPAETTTPTIRITKKYALEELHVSGTNLSAIGGRDFEPFANLLHLYLSRNAISRVWPGAFQTTPNLLTLDLSVNHVATLPSERLHGLFRLVTLNLSRNAIESVDRFTGDLKALQKLDLSHNRVERIERDTFAYLDSLAELHLHGNRLTTVSPDAFRPLKKLRVLDVGRNRLRNLPLNAFRPLETQLRTLRIEDNPLQCDCGQLEVWEWLNDHQKMINDGNRAHYASLRCELPAKLKGRTFLRLDPSAFCPVPLVVMLTIEDIQPFSVVVSWQSRNNSRVHAYRIAYSPISRLEYATNSSSTATSKILDSETRSIKLIELYANTRYLICVVGLSDSSSTTTTAAAAATTTTAAEQLAEGESSRCTEVRTLNAGDDYQARQQQESSILTRRLGLIIGSCMGCVVFVILVIVLAYMKVKKQRKNAKKEQPLPPEYLSYRHFSLQGCDPLSTIHAAQRATAATPNL